MSGQSLHRISPSLIVQHPRTRLQFRCCLSGRGVNIGVRQPIVISESRRRRLKGIVQIKSLAGSMAS